MRLTANTRILSRLLLQVKSARCVVMARSSIVVEVGWGWMLNVIGVVVIAGVCYFLAAVQIDVVTKNP